MSYTSQSVEGTLAENVEQDSQISEGVKENSTPTETVQEGEKEIPQWEQRRINALTRRAAEAERRAALAEQREAALRQRLPEGAIPQEELAREEIATRFQSAVQQEAAKRQFDAECTSIYNSGMEELPGFDGRLRNFSQVGGLNPVLVEAIMESAQGAGAPKAHRILFELGGNLEEAQRIVELPPVRMAAAVAKFAASLRENVVKVSGAPAPLTPVTSKASPVEKDPEKMSPQEWREWREKQLEARKKR